MNSIVTLVLAGGKGERLQPLTQHRAKPAVPFGGVYRIVDFVLSNCIHSGLRQILVLTQYKSQSLQLHLKLAWSGFRRDWGEFLEVVPAQQRRGDRWYSGTADAVYQNFHEQEVTRSEHLLILAADHIYRMDYRPLLRAHAASNADATVACLPVPITEGPSFGIMQTDGDGVVVAFEEKPDRPEPIPGDPQHCLASMGVYVFRTDVLLAHLERDARDVGSRHDFGRNIVPDLLRSGRVRAFRFADDSSQDAYWRDVGTLDAYFEANMDLLQDNPPLDLHTQSPRIFTYLPPAPPPLICLNCAPGSETEDRIRKILVGPGSVIANADVRNSILSSFVRIDRGAEVVNSVIFDGVHVQEGARLQNVIVDKDVNLPAGIEIGFDVEVDRRRGFTVTESGRVVVPKRHAFDRRGSSVRPGRRAVQSRDTSPTPGGTE
ncbi:MAG: glucose-1-phosphate adenylyltransferase [Planctomycetaceae bacterium]|nr:glucose-1-phosphate adenylyltransferase [Planctomycetaceae bacterium]